MTSFLSKNGSSCFAFIGVEWTIGSTACKVLKFIAGLGEIGGGVTLDLMERDLFGGNAGGRLESFVISFIAGVIDNDWIKKKIILLTNNPNFN